jgi:hypothetical protein
MVYSKEVKSRKSSTSNHQHHQGVIMEKSDSNKSMGPKIIPPHGGYRDLKSYQMAEIVHDATALFCDRLIDRQPAPPPRTHDQLPARAGKLNDQIMVQAAHGLGGRHGKQNIAEGSTASGTSKKTELKLIGAP